MRILLIISACFIYSISFSQIINGSFENSTNNWNVYGNATYNSNCGSLQVNTPTSIHNYGPNLVPQSGFDMLIMATGGTTSVSQMETIAELTPGTIEIVDENNSTFGSIISQKIYAEAGQTLSFHISFMTEESSTYWNNSIYGDYSFFTISSSTIHNAYKMDDTDTMSYYRSIMGTYADCGATFAMPGFRYYSYTFTTTDTFNICIGILNNGDNTGISYLLVDYMTLDHISSINDLYFNISNQDTLILDSTSVLNAFFNNDTTSSEICIINSLPNHGSLFFHDSGLIYPILSNYSFYSNAADSVFYVPNSSFIGIDSFFVSYRDIGNISIGAKIYINVNGINNINNITTNPTLSIFPNPAHDFITLYFSNPDESYNLEIFSIHGKKIIEYYNISTNKVDISKFIPGYYIVKTTCNTFTNVGQLIKY